MSSFLQKLKSGASVVDNNALPDNAGVVTRKLEKKTLAQPPEQLGIKFGIDAEVLNVNPRTPAAAANIPAGFMVFDVNGEFVENEEQFLEAARKNVNLVIKLQSTAGISELISLVLRDEERLSNGEISQSTIDFDNLLKTTPRFNFLSGDHPLFLRYDKRLKQARRAAALIAQRTHEADVQRQKEMKERMKKALEEEQAAERRKVEQEKAARQRILEAEQSHTLGSSEPFIKIVTDESEFGKAVQEEKKSEPAASAKASPAPESFPSASPSVSPAMAPEQQLPSTPPAEVTPLSVAAPPTAITPVTTEELLALIGLPTDVAGSETPTPAEPSVPSPEQQDEATVRYVSLPAEQYTLCSGKTVVSVVKKRTGPIPAPPPGDPSTSSGNTASQVDYWLKISTGDTIHRTQRKRRRSPSSDRQEERRYSSRRESHRNNYHRSSPNGGHRSSSDSRRRR